MYNSLARMNAYERHKALINQYVLHYGGQKAWDEAQATMKAPPAAFETEADIVRKHHQFIRQDLPLESKDAVQISPSAVGSSGGRGEKWELQLTTAYYERLFKEYALCDLSRYREGKIAMRWRVQSEVFSGKGHLSCGNTKCSSASSLTSWEVPFAYTENNERKSALVKLRLCPKCSKKLHYHRRKHEKKERSSKQASSDSSSEGPHTLKHGPDESNADTNTRERDRPKPQSNEKPIPDTIDGILKSLME